MAVPQAVSHSPRPIPPKTLLRTAGRALGEFAMLRPHDRVMVALSGGKDSLSLLHVLRAVQVRSRIPFSLAAATVDPGIATYDPAFLKPYVAALGIPYRYVTQHIVERAKDSMRGDSFCSYCARMRRGALYDAARALGCNVLALGHHFDDLAESFLMSAFHEGRLHTMRAHYQNDAGDVRVIRPLCYVRERQLVDFATSAGLPAIQDNCPACFGMPTERVAMKTLLASEEGRHRRLFLSLRHALRPLMGEAPPAP